MSESQVAKLEKRVKALEEQYVQWLVLANRLLAAEENIMEVQHRNFAARVREKKR